MSDASEAETAHLLGSPANAEHLHRALDQVNAPIDPNTGTPWIPEFEGQRPPFQPGNQLAVTHGAYSSKRVDPIARRYIDELAQDAGLEYLQAPRFHAALWAWATAMARVELLGEWVDSMPIQDAANSDRGSTSALELHRKWMATAQTAAARLGLDPLSAARLGKDIAGTRQADAATLLTRARAEAEATPDVQ